MHRNFVAFFLSVVLSAPALAANYPFPQNQPQPFAAYYPTYSNADVVAVFNDWKTQQVTTAGAGGFRRVQRNGDPTLQPNSTVSEGIGYGMIIAVYMNDQALFDDLWRYYNLHLDGNGLMHWYISADGATILGNGAASDADQDVAWALCMAIYQWGTSTYGPTYSSMAQTLITKLYNVYVDPTTKAFWPWGGAGNTFNVSYFDPSQYRVFAQVSGNSAWLNVVDGCYTALQNSLKPANGNASNGLVPAWSNFAGDPVPGFAGAPTHYQYDSCRTPFRFIKDWYFFGEPRALSYAAKINSFYVPIGADHITDGYDLNGAPRPQYDLGGTGATGQSAAFVAPALGSAMASSANAAFSQLAYDRLKTNTLLIGGPYYDQCWTVMGMLMATGNYLNYVPTPTPTPTPDACQFRVKVNVGGSAQAGYSADKVWSTGSWGYLAAQAGAVGTSGGPVAGTDPGLYLDERYGTDVRYRFSGVPNGSATVTLQWAETYFTAAGQRQMDVSLNGTQVENNLDVFAAAAGRNKALVRNYVVNVTTGQIDLILTGAVDNATIHAISIQAGPLCSPTVSPTGTPNWTKTSTPSRTASATVSPSFSASPTRSPSFTISPTFTAIPTPDACTVVRRLNSGGGAFTDGQGLVWAADQAYAGGGYGYVSFAAGTVGTSAGPIAGTTDDALYTNERYGNPVRYRFDVANGAYRVRLLLAETYFASAGQRSLTVVANGVTVLNNADLFSFAGGLNVARELTFTASAAAGQLYVEVSSGNNNGTIMGIEIVSVAGCTPTSTRTSTPGAAPSNTASPTATPSFTRSSTATPSSSRTVTLSATASGTPTLTPSPTGTRSATASPTGSASTTASFTLSPSPSASPSMFVSGTFTRTVTRTPSASHTLSVTGSATPSGTPSATVSVTPSISPTFSESKTITPGPSPTYTPTATRTPSFTVSASATPSTTVTVTPTSSSTPSVSATPSRSVTVSPSASPSMFVSATFTRTVTATPSATATNTAGVPSLTQTPLPSVTFTTTSTSTATSTRSSTGTATSSASPTPPSTAVATATATPLPSAVPSGTPTQGSTSTTALSTGLPLEIIQSLPVPNPNPDRLAILAQGGPGELELKLYTSAMVCVGQAVVTVGPGWNQVRGLDLSSRANGLYYVHLKAAGDKKSAVRVGKLCILR